MSGPIPELLHALRRAWAPHERRAIYDWAAEHITLTSDYALPGPFHVGRSRYLIEPFHAIADDAVRVVTIQKGVQSGGSLLGDLTMLWVMANRPQNAYWNFPTDQQAKDYAERRARNLIEANSITAHLLQDVREATAEGRHKIRTTELHLAAMWLAFQGANEGNLQSHSVPFLINEELWQWNPGMYQQACARTSFFEWRKKIINISQGGAKGGDLDTEFHAGTREEWSVPCPECRHYQPLLWSEPTGQHTHDGQPLFAGITWENSEATRPGGKWHFDKLRPTIRTRCIKCLKEWPDEPALRRRADDLGQYERQNAHAPSEQRSFHWPSWASPDVALFTVVKEFLEAKDQELIGNRVPIQEWYRRRLAVSYDPALHAHFEMVPTIELATGAASKPQWELQKFIFLLVDVQRDHFRALIQAWSETGQDLNFWYGKLATWDDIAELQRAWNVPDQCVFLDCRHKPATVYQQCVLHGHAVPLAGGRTEWVCWRAMMGDGRKEFIHTPQHGPDKGRRIRLPFSWPPTWADPCLGLDPDDPLLPRLRGKMCPVISFAKGTLDGLSFERRAHMLRGQTSLVAPGPWNRDFAREMQGEQPEVSYSPQGHEKTFSHKVGPNHALDCYRMGLAAACIAKILNPLS